MNRAMAEIDLSGTQNPADIKEAKDELESIEKAAEKVLMTDNEIDDFIALENEYPQLREMMENWQAVNRNLLDNMFFARIIGKRRYNKLKSIKDYVPWYRITRRHGRHPHANRRSDSWIDGRSKGALIPQGRAPDDSRNSFQGRATRL
jgi:hypothetical protein